MLRKLFSRKRLQTKLIVTAVIAMVIHNFFYSIFGFEDAIFFFISVLSFLGFIGYTIVLTGIILAKGKYKKLLKPEQLISILITIYLIYIIITRVL